MRKYILDTDMGCDCDDIGALSIMLNAVNKGEAELLCVTHAINNIHGLRFIENMINGAGLDIPVYKCAVPGFMEEGHKNVYDFYVKPFTGDNTNTDYKDSLKAMRKLLAENDKVTVITIGSFVNVEALLKSELDEISDKNGIELVAEKVEAVYSMAGNFVNENHGEFNVVCCLDGARYFAEHCPVPVIYSGFEVGEKILTGGHLESFPDDSLIKKGYFEYSKKTVYTRPSWDPTTVY
ncbi:MAG: nucleoside hydrolase, partial [Clostridia bacterium]|nr:nucleoside hydrolase [Clostridia bacterium]